MTKPKVPLAAAQEDTAYHEAGHCVAIVEQRLPFEYVTIKSDKDVFGEILYQGVSQIEHSTKRERKSIARGHIIAAYGGFEAEKLFNRAADESLSADDDQNAMQLSREFGVMPRRCSHVGDDAHLAYLQRLRS